MRRNSSLLLELQVLSATLLAVGALAVPWLKSATVRRGVAAVAADAKALDRALDAYYADHHAYPDAVEPLVDQGYYDRRIFDQLAERRADAYDAPDDRGPNQEFWLELTLAADPSVRFLIAHSDDAPLAAGSDYDGVYLLDHGVLTELVPEAELQ